MLGKAPYVIKLWTLPEFPDGERRCALLGTYIARLDTGLVEICHGQNSFPDVFGDTVEEFEDEAVCGQIECLDHKYGWMCEIFKRKEARRAVGLVFIAIP